MAQRKLLSQHEFLQGFKAGLPALSRELENSFSEGSRNQIVGGGGPDGGSFVVPWQGLAGQGDDTGTRLLRQVLSTWGGLKDYFVGSIRIEGKGSFFSDVGKSLWDIGSGVPSIEGLAIAPGIFASTELQVSIATNGLYSAAKTFDAGLPQPSTPDIGIISSPGFGFTGFIDGPISCKIARLRLTTGARSVSSQTSAVISPAKKTVRVTFPLPSVGQDNWAVFFTQSGFGGVGLHYRAAYLLALDVPEATVAAGIIDGIPRSLEFDFKDGDLVPEVAYIDDYPPPAGTHAVRLANVMCVLGAYGDSTAPVTASDPGTVGAISLPNFYESYKPSHLVYFPEQVVDVLARPTDEYAYVGHRNSITALQYVGVLDGPAVAVSMVWPDIGIAKPHNWCQVHGLLYLFQAKGGPVRMMPDGSPDYSFAAPVRRYMRDWTVEDTIVGSHPDSLSVVYFNGREALSWSLQAQKWSPPCFFEDVCVEDHPIPSSSPSSSLSPSASPSSSFSASPSGSRSSSPSTSDSASPSSSISSSPSASPSSSVSSSPSTSLSASPSSSLSASPSPSPSSSLSASPSASPSGSPSSSASASNPPSGPFMLTATPGNPRSDFDGPLGFRFTVGGANITVTELGRWRYTGNAASHVVTILEDNPGAGYPVKCTVSIDMSSGTVGTWKYAAVTPVVLTSGVAYLCVSQEANGGDQWSDDNITGITTDTEATITHSAYSPNGGVTYQTNNTGVKSYIPPNFQYFV